MKWFENIVRNLKKSSDCKSKKKAEERAKYIYQIEEYNGQLWYTCNGMLFCPCSLACGDDDSESKRVALLNMIRELYVRRSL